MTKLIKISSLSDFMILENLITNNWLKLEKESNAFRYKLNVQKQKSLGGKLNFLVQVRIWKSKMNVAMVIQMTL